MKNEGHYPDLDISQSHDEYIYQTRKKWAYIICLHTEPSLILTMLTPCAGWLNRRP